MSQVLKVETLATSPTSHMTPASSEPCQWGTVFALWFQQPCEDALVWTSCCWNIRQYTCSPCKANSAENAPQAQHSHLSSLPSSLSSSRRHCKGPAPQKTPPKSSCWSKRTITLSREYYTPSLYWPGEGCPCNSPLTGAQHRPQRWLEHCRPLGLTQKREGKPFLHHFASAYSHV